MANRPLFFLLFSFCSGIIAGFYVPVEPIILVFLASLFCVLLCILFARARGSQFLPLIVFFFIGILASTRIPDPDKPPLDMQKILRKKSQILMGTIAEPLQWRPHSTRMLLELQALKEGERWRRVTGKILISVRNCEKNWAVGQLLVGRVRVKPVRNFNNPGGFNYRQYLANQRIWAKGYVRSDRDLARLNSPELTWKYLTDVIRQGSNDFIHAWLPQDFAGFYRALLLGERYAIDLDLRELLYNAGIGHLLAISGLHLGLVAGFAFVIFYFVLLRFPPIAERWGARPAALVAAFPVALGYGLLTGMGLPAFRATLMLAVFSFALVFQREKDLLNSVILAAFIILTMHPESLFTASFQLSFIGVTALVCLLPILPVPQLFRAQDGKEEKLQRLGRRLYQFLGASLILSLFTAPVVLYHFHRLTPLAVFTNLIAVPLVGFWVLPAGLLALCFMPVSASLAGLILTLGTIGLDLIITAASIVSSLPWASLWPGTPRAWQVVLVYIVLLIPLAKATRRHRFGLMAFCLPVLIASWIVPIYYRSASCSLRVTYLDVSQGNSAVVEFPGDGVMLIDGGGFHSGSFDVGRYVIAPFLWYRRVTQVDNMVLSHAHPDHFQGLHFVTRHFPVVRFWHNGVSTDDPRFVKLVRELAMKRIVTLGPEQLSSIRQIDGIDFCLLHPPADFRPQLRGTTDKELNNSSLVLRLTYGNISFLFPGDIEKAVESGLAKLEDLEHVDVLLVPHHGSQTSSSMEFLQRLKPKIAVFSVGFDNPFRLPSAQVIERYRSLGVEIYRTDRHGAITISTDGKQIEVKTFLPVAT